jgi:hypothetical protein
VVRLLTGGTPPTKPLNTVSPVVLTVRPKLLPETEAIVILPPLVLSSVVFVVRLRLSPKD